MSTAYENWVNIYTLEDAEFSNHASGLEEEPAVRLSGTVVETSPDIRKPDIWEQECTYFTFCTYKQFLRSEMKDTVEIPPNKKVRHIIQRKRTKWGFQMFFCCWDNVSVTRKEVPGS
jgi:hypothetical protein